MYENVTKVFGPYKAKDNRLRIVLEFNDGKHKTISYPKYLMEKHLNRYLDKDETIDHIDGNPLNNDISNLRILSRKEHCYNDAIRNKDVKVTCTYCGKEFYINGSNLSQRNRPDKHQSGYFCSKTCIGKYGAEIQKGTISTTTVNRITTEKFTLHKN